MSLEPQQTPYRNTTSNYISLHTVVQVLVVASRPLHSHHHIGRSGTLSSSLSHGCHVVFVITSSSQRSTSSAVLPPRYSSFWAKTRMTPFLLSRTRRCRMPTFVLVIATLCGVSAVAHALAVAMPGGMVAHRPSSWCHWCRCSCAAWCEVWAKPTGFLARG